MKGIRRVLGTGVAVIGCCLVMETESFADGSEDTVQPILEMEEQVLPEQMPPEQGGFVLGYVQIAGQIQLNDAQELNFNNAVIAELEVFIEELKQFPYLKKVEMCNTNLSNEQMQILRVFFPDIKFVWVVHCANFSVRTDAVAFSTRVTGYGRDPYTEKDFEVLKYCTDLEALDLGHHSMSDISFLKELKNLKILIIAINRIKDISPLAELTDLTYLELFLNQIEDLSPLEGLVNLEHLNLCHNKTLGEIEPILHFPLLQRLWISYSNLTQDEIARIRGAYPTAWLEFEVYESVQAGWRSTEVYPRMRNVFNHNQMDEMFLPKITPEVVSTAESSSVAESSGAVESSGVTESTVWEAD